MPTGHYRFRTSLGNVSSLFRGARRDTFPLFTGLLDTFPGAAFAASLRALSSGWVAGDVVEVRRSDFGGGADTADFTASQILSGAMLAFVTEFNASGDGFVATWYDQSGNGDNATQATTTMQPRIVISGVLVDGGLDFDGVDDFFNANGVAAALTGTDQSLSSFTVVNSDVAATTQYILSCGRTAASNPLKNTLFHSGGNIGFQVRDDSGVLKSDLSAVPYSASDTYIISNTSGGLVLDFAQNGTLAQDDFDVDVGLLTIDTVKIGANANGSSSPLNGQMAEMIIYASDQSANRVGIETNIHDFYPDLLFPTDFPMSFTVQTDNTGTSNDDQVTIPWTNNGVFNCVVNWGDGNEDTITTYNDAAWTHTYDSDGEYSVTITGSVGQLQFANGGDKLKITGAFDMGAVGIGIAMIDSVLQGCTNVTSVVYDVLDQTSITSMFRSFQSTGLTAWAQDLPPTVTSLRNGWSSSPIESWTGTIPSGVLNCDQSWFSCNLSSWSEDLPDSITDCDFAWKSNALVTWTGTIPAGSLCINYSQAWDSNALDVTSVNFIITQIEAAGTSNGTLGINGGTNAAPTGAGATAVTALQGRGWTVTTN